MTCPPMTPALKERIQNIIDGGRFTSHNEITCLLVEPDHVRVQGLATDRYFNGAGNVHGGLFLTLADTAAGLAALTDGRRYVTQSCSFNFIRPMNQGKIIADGYVIHRGRTMAVTRAVLTDENGTLIAEGTFNMFHVGGPA